MSYTSRYVTHRGLIPARVENEKDDAVCPESPTGVHFALIRYDEQGVLHMAARACEACGEPIKARGARWVLDSYVISEEDDIADLL